MNSNKVHFVIDLAIGEGKSEEFSAVAKRMIDNTSKEPGALAYEWYLSSDNKHCRLLETYIDVDAMQKHLATPTVQELVPKLLKFATISRFEVYGTPDAESAAMLNSFGAQIYPHWRGLPSLQSATAN